MWCSTPAEIATNYISGPSTGLQVRCTVHPALHFNQTLLVTLSQVNLGRRTAENRRCRGQIS